jgi:hypothetical protein
VQPLPPGYSSQGQITQNALERQVGFALPGLAALIVALVGGFLGWRWFTRRRHPARRP